MPELRVVDSITELGSADAGCIAMSDARSTLNDGIITRVNAVAQALGISQGQPCRAAVAGLQNRQQEISP